MFAFALAAAISDWSPSKSKRFLTGTSGLERRWPSVPQQKYSMRVLR